MDLNAIRIFIHIVRQNSLSAAADALGMPKSTVSSKLAQLESALGVRLLHRTTRNMALTEEGRFYFEQAAHLIDGLQETAQLLDHRQAMAGGRIRISAPPELGAYCLGRLLGDFRARHPSVEIEIELSGHPVNLVGDRFDLALCFGDLSDSSLVCRRLLTMERKLVASARYLEERGVPTTPNDVDLADCLVHAIQMQSGGWRLHGKSGPAILRPASSFVANNYLLLRDAARQGHGITLLPEYLCRDDLRDQRLVEVLPEWSLEPAPLFAIYPSKKHISTRLKRLLEHLSRIASEM